MVTDKCDIVLHYTHSLEIVQWFNSSYFGHQRISAVINESHTATFPIETYKYASTSLLRVCPVTIPLG